MKVFKSAIVLIFIMSLFSTMAFAGAREKACEMVLCLYGEKTGFGGKIECDPALAEYKKIMKKSKFTKKILCEQTKEMRLAKLLTCEQDEYDVKDLINCDE